MKYFYKISKLFISIIVLSTVLIISGCGGGSGGGSGSEVGVQNTDRTLMVLHGSVGDGPIVGASVKVFNKDGDLVGEQASDNTASYELSVRVNRGAYPLILEATGGQDIVTGSQPDFILSSIVLSPSVKKRVNINPFSTMVVKIAAGMIGGLTAENVATATQIVLQKMNFGLDQAVMPNPVSSSIDATNIAVIVRSSEALGEMVRRTRDALQVVQSNITADDVVSTLAADLLDGFIDGDGSVNADPRVAAVANIVSAQVLSEVLTGALHVNNADASVAMDNAVLVSVPTTDTTTSVNDLPIVSEMLAQTRVALLAAQAIDLNPTLVEAGNLLVNVQPGSQPVDIATVFPTDISSVLSNALSSITIASDSSLELVNSVVRQDGEVSGTINTTLTISGTPATKVTEGSIYTFVPTTNVAEMNALSFSITNLPGWASFSAATGGLSGTPTGQDVGLWSGIVISVTDGAATVSLPAFSINVSAIPNTAPSISGTPQTSVEENSAYYFAPTASDTNGDSLRFSVSNLPTWASFNSVSGAISGTPANADVKVWSGIVISVTDGTATVSLPAFSITVSAIPNTAPSISGTPQTSVEENSAYYFAPTASDANGDSLNFSATNVPAWVSFNPVTGELSGIPGASDVGVTKSIIITVSDGVDSVSLPSFSITVTAVSSSTGTATLSWLPPTENTDGTVLSDLGGYKIYYGTSPGNYTSVITIDNPGLSSYVVDNLPGGNTYYFVVTAMTTSGIESGYSTEGSKTIP